MAETPTPVGYWCDHTDEPRGQRTHEGWDLSDTGQEWTRQPDTISSHTGVTDWDPEQRRCPRAVPVYAVDAPALVAALQRRTEEWEGEQAARVKAEQATIAADQRARQAEAERDESAKQVTCLTEVMAGTVLLGADDATGMLRALTESLVEDGTLTPDQAARVYAGLDKQHTEQGRLADQVKRVRDIHVPHDCGDATCPQHGLCEQCHVLSPCATITVALNGTEAEPAQDADRRG